MVMTHMLTALGIGVATQTGGIIGGNIDLTVARKQHSFFTHDYCISFNISM